MFDQNENKYTSNSRLDEVLAIAKKYNATLPDFVQIESGKKYEITTAAALGGIIEQNPPGSSLSEGATVEFKTVPLYGWSFIGWSGDYTGTEPSFTISSLSSDFNINATFTFVSTDSNHYEGENTTMYNASAETTNSGYSGNGYANFGKEIGSSIEFAVCVSEEGKKNVVITFANGSSINRPVSVNINGSTAINSLSFDPTDSWTTWDKKTISVNLNKGINTIKLISLNSNGGPNIDNIELESSVSTITGFRALKSGIKFNPSNYTITLNTNNKAVEVNLLTLNGKVVLSRKLITGSGNKQFKLPVNYLYNGCYLLKVSTDDISRVHVLNLVK